MKNRGRFWISAQTDCFGAAARWKLMIRWLHQQQVHLYYVKLRLAQMEKRQFAEEFVVPAKNNSKTLRSLLSQEIQTLWYVRNSVIKYTTVLIIFMQQDVQKRFIPFIKERYAKDYSFKIYSCIFFHVIM